MLRASSCALDSRVLFRGVSMTPRSSPYADEEVTVVGRTRSPRLMPFTTTSSMSPGTPGGAVALVVVLVVLAAELSDTVVSSAKASGLAARAHHETRAHRQLLAERCVFSSIPIFNPSLLMVVTFEFQVSNS